MPVVRAVIIAVALLLVSCGSAHARRPRGTDVVPVSVTDTAAGRNRVRLDMAEDLIESGKTTEARQVLDVAAEEGAPKGEIALLQGRALAYEGLTTSALEKLDEAHKAMPRDPRPLRAIGLVQADLQHIDEALTAFERATQLDDTDAATWNNYGFLLLSAKRYEAAARALEHAVMLDGSVPRYRRNLGYALAALGRDREALAAFRGAGTEADAQADFGLAFELKGDLDHAKEHYEAALAADDSHEPALQGLARLSQPAEEAP